MNKKISIITSSIAACAILASIFAFNGFAAQSTNVENTAAVKQDTATQQGIIPTEDIITKSATVINNQETAPVVKATTTDLTSVKNTACSNTQNTQSCNNQQTTTKSANVAKVITNMQNAINNANCDKTTAKTRNYSALQSKIDELLKSYSSSSAKPANNSSTTKTTANKSVTTATSTQTAAKPAASMSTNGDYSASQKEVVELVNKERANNGLKPLTMSTQLNKTATLKSQDMAKLNYFDHNSPTYGSPFNMMKTYGISYRSAGENIAMGQTTPEQVMQGWMNSPGHRANILKSSFTQIGVGIAKNSSGRLYWTQQFIG